MAVSVEGTKHSGSLVLSILQQGATLNNVHLEESIQRVQKKCDSLKLEVLEFLKQNYDEFIVHADSIVSLEQKVKEVTIEHQRLTTLIENDLKGRLARSANKREEVEERYKETEVKITFVQSLVEIHAKIEECQREMKREQFMRAANLVKGIGELIKLVGGIGCDAKVFGALKQQLSIAGSDLKCELQEQWNAFIKWKPVPVGEVDLGVALQLVHTVPHRSSRFEGVVRAMRTVLTKAEWEERVKKYAMKLFNTVIKPLLVVKKLTIVVTEPKDESIDISFNEVESASVEGILGDLYVILDKVRLMMAEEDQWMGLISEFIEPDVTNLLIKGVLTDCSPTTSAEREKYSVISSSVADFEKNMKSIGFVDAKYTSLTDYTSNVDVHITRQECQDLLGKARSILMQPLHDTVTVSSDNTKEMLVKLQLPTGGLKSGQEDQPEHLQVTDKELDIQSLSFTFPQCLVSKSTKEFVDLLHQTLIRCTSVSEATATKLYYSCRNMIELFIAMSESYHKQSVEQLPRNSVTQHNNYMFLAHSLLPLGHQFNCSIPLTGGVSFIDYVPQLRRLGENCFLSEMEKQAINVAEFLKPVQSFEDISSNPSKQEELSRGVRQGFLQIYSLSKIYSEVLPVDLAKRCKGGLLNFMIKELVSRALSLEDISVSDATFLYNFIQQDVLEKGPVALSLTKEEVTQLPSVCLSWEQLKELAFVLDAEQEDIVIRWDKGNGSLAKHMSAAEVKHLIRALFKNTDRRANTLSKISN